MGDWMRYERRKENVTYLEEICIICTDRNKYIDLYLKRLNATWLKAATKEDNEKMEAIKRNMIIMIFYILDLVLLHNFEYNQIINL